jgi:SpoVK/Ycf46/Vps4 family AAA+-type ATPase
MRATPPSTARDGAPSVGYDTPSPPRIVVLAATNRPDALDPAVRRPGRFDREVEVGIPTGLGREDILSKMLAPLPHALSRADIQSISAKAHGFVGADLRALCQEAGMVSLRRSLPRQTGSGNRDGASTAITSTTTSASTVSAANITLDDLHLALGRITPSAMREVAVEVPSVRWSDIGGQEDVKQRLREAVEWPLQRPEVFEIMGIRPPKGVLLYGPPGCSKTLMAKAVATESGMNFIAVKGPELFNKWVGESERAVAEIFRKARAAAPAVVFFDEIDALASQRGSEGDSGGVADRVLSQLLTELDGVRPLKQVVVLAATNRPDLIDAALTRPGRIDRRLYVSPPDAAARVEILRIHSKSTPLAADVNLSAIAAQCAGLSGAEIAAVCRESALHAIEEDANAQKVFERHFLLALEDVEPQITPAMLAFFESFG